MIYLPPKCLNYDNLSIKVRIMAADTWHFSFHSLPCWGTTSYLITAVHGNLEMFFNCAVYERGKMACYVIANVLFEVPVWLGLGPWTQIRPMGESLSVFYYSWLFEGLLYCKCYMKRKHYRSLLTVLSQWYQSKAYVCSYSTHIKG